ncbi:MAG: ankyrin repeat domain-containing protein [Phycisphaerales bacterium]
MIDSRHRSYRCFLLHVRSISTGLAAMLWICVLAYAQPDIAQVQPGAQHPIVVDPATLELGKLQAYVRHRRFVTLTNTANAPIKVLNIKGTGAMRFLWSGPRVLRPGQSTSIDFLLSAGRAPGQQTRRGIHIAVEGDYPPLRFQLRGEAYADIAFEPTWLRLDEDPTGRISIWATDGEPFRVLAVDPPIALGVSDEPRLKHEIFLPLERFEHKERRLFTIYLDKPTCNVVQGIVSDREWIRRQPQTPNEKLFSGSRGSSRWVDEALRAGADPSAVDAFGTPALLYTAKNLHGTLSQTLLDAGAAIDATDTRGQTALMWAINYGRSDVARMLVDRGASVGMRDVVGGTALMLAARYGDHSTIEMLLAAGADPEAVDKLGLRALHWASLRGNLKTTKALLDNQANANAQSEGRLLTPLMCAARRGYTEVIKVLLEAGADVEAIDNAGRTALMWAVKESHPEAARILQDPGTEQP